MQSNFGDIVDVLLDQHEQLRRLCAEVEAAPEAAKKRPFADLTRLIQRHEYGERTVVHPVTRDRAAGGDPVGRASLAEEQRIEAALSELADLGVDHPAFGGKFALLRRALLDHADHEESDEFPLLRRYVRAEQLHTLANEIRDVQAMY